MVCVVFQDFFFLFYPQLSIIVSKGIGIFGKAWK